MTTGLNNTRRWWRPILGAGTAINCVAYPWGGLVIAFLKPELAAQIVAMMGVLFTFAASLYGIREYGKSKGNE